MGLNQSMESAKSTESGELKHDENLDELDAKQYTLGLEKENAQLKEIINEMKSKCDQYLEICERNLELQTNVAQVTDRLNRSNQQVEMFNKERETYLNHVNALKEVVRVTKEMIRIRDVQLNHLQEKIKEIENRLADKELVLLSNDLRTEYDRQLNNIQNLRDLYENRQAELRNERDTFSLQLIAIKEKLDEAQNENKELKERVTYLENDASVKYDKISYLESNLGLSEAECRELKYELHVINQLFGQILFGYHNNSYDNIDLDKLLNLLEENHDLLKEISLKENDEYSTVLPKTLLDLISQTIPNSNNDVEICENGNSENENENFVANLPKVWRILITLLDQQEKKSVVSDINVPSEHIRKSPCYKAIETSNGPKYVLSLSQTYIHLKDLILEKKHLEKETQRLKQLNGHLESCLQDQESKLESVLSELSKTWHLVDRIQKQHEQLHTHESVLKYDLGQKKNLVQNLKKELDDCKQKWDKAREKNSHTEKQWTILKLEFDARKSSIDNSESDNQSNSQKEIPHDSAEFDKYMEKKNTRLKKLEEQCNQLLKKVTDTSLKSDEIVTKLDELHQNYV